MHDHEPSYYEIALTNRQVMVAFVILLVCLMGTFFAGVWVGRGDQAAARAERAPDQVAAEEQSIEELDFFGGGGEVAAPSGDAVERRPPEIVVDEPPAEPAAPREDPAVQRNRRGDDQRAAGAGAGDEDGTPPAQAPAGAAARSPGDPPRDQAPPTTTRPVPAEGRPVEGPVVQVFSSRDRGQAQRMVDRLTDGGQPAYLSPVEVDGTTMFRVRIGPFEDRAQAQRVADQVKRSYRLDTWITQ